VRALPVFSQHVLQHRSIQRQLGHQLLQPAGFVLELLELADLIDLQPAVMFFPALERLLADPHPPDQLRHRQPHLRLLHDRHDLFDRESLALHSLSNWINYWGAAQTAPSSKRKCGIRQLAGTARTSVLMFSAVLIKTTAVQQ